MLKKIFKTKNKKITSIVLFGLILILAISTSLISNQSRKGTVAGTWYDYDWQYKKTITIDHTKVDDDLTDFPVLINLDSDAQLAANAQADGDDIFFTLSNDSTKLSHEIETYVTGTGQLVAWVKIPTLADLTDTEIYMYYGNGTCASQENITDVWDSSTKAVFHFNESSGTIYDSSLNGNNGSSEGDIVYNIPSKIYNGVSITGANERFTIADNGTLNQQSIWTVSFWGDLVNPTSGRDWAYFSGYWTVGKSGTHLSVRYGNTESTGPVVSSGWHFYTVSCNADAANNLKFYIDGQLSSAITFAIPSVPSGNKRVGDRHIYNENWVGGLDEMNIASNTRSAEWISTEYSNQNSPGTFYNLGSQTDWDTVDPTNPTTFKTYASSAKTVEYTNGGWGNATAPYFEWSGATDVGGSGVDGYYLYFGTNASADPEVTSGLVEGDASPHFTTDSNFTLSEAMAEDTTYYFRIKTRDNHLNVSFAGDMFEYSFETSSPDPVEYVNVSPAGCSTASNFDFSWPAPSDNGPSGIGSYDYKLGTGGTIQNTANLSVSGTPYQDMENVFFTLGAGIMLVTSLTG